MGSFRSSLAFLLVLSGAAGGQTPPPTGGASAASGPQRVDGQVDRPGKGRMDPVSGVWVTLHRVAQDKQGPLDSVRTDSRGRYSFRYERTGDPDAVYFVSVSHDGIAYFSSPFETARVFGLDAEITVFDTTSRHVPISIRGRHLVISSVDANGMRAVDEVYELANDSSMTKIASGSSPDQAVWSAPMLAGATAATVRQGDFPAAAVGFSGGRLSLFAPLAPGLKQLSVSYSLPAGAFPESISIPAPTAVFEVLLEEPVGTVTGPHFKEVTPVTAEQRNFRRFLAADVPVNSVVAVDLPMPRPRGSSIDSRFIVAITLALGGVMAAVLANALRRK